MMYQTVMVLPAAGDQGSLFGDGPPGIDPGFRGLRRRGLGRGAWVDHLPGWVEGHQTLFAVLWETTRWRLERRPMYDRIVDVPRLVASLPEDGPGHPVVARMAEALTARYGRDLHQISLAGYRDGRDSVAFHGDRLGRARADAIVAIVSLGTPRRFLLRPAGGGRSHAFQLGWGDLLVMGGTCQQTFEHGVPKVAHAEPRMSVQFRSAPEVEAGPRSGQGAPPS
jgi:alkylated DNA repair dioxygenase AlkB